MISYIEHVLTKVFNYKSSQTIKKKFLKQVEYRCVSCGNKGSWLNKPLTLELHHRDGDRKNNRFSNLELLCCNCHSQTQNYKKKKIIIID